MDIVVVGPSGGETNIALNNGTGFRADFLNRTFVKNSLGPSAKEIIAEDRASIREERQKLKEAEKQQEQLSYQREKENKEVEVLRGRIDQTQAKIDAIQDKQGSSLESEELRRLRHLKKNLQTDFENMVVLEKRAKNKEKEQAKVERLRASITGKESDRNLLEERLNSTKPLDDLKEQESKLQHQNEEDKAILQDENASPSDIEAARERVAERNEELARLQTQIAERERTRSLLERIKEIFKKYCVTVTAILLAVGITIGAVVGSITKALKATGQALGNGLKDVGAKLGSQSCRPSHRVSGRAHLAADSCHGGLFVRKIS